MRALDVIGRILASRRATQGRTSPSPPIPPRAAHMRWAQERKAPSSPPPTPPPPACGWHSHGMGMRAQPRKRPRGAAAVAPVCRATRTRSCASCSLATSRC
eukprot:scaffold22420_cov124-Isochrysis_galbana.AAC.2